jgi:hypothetical protein
MQAGNVYLFRDVKIIGSARYGDITFNTSKMGCEILDTTSVQLLDQAVLAGKFPTPVGTTGKHGRLHHMLQQP